MTFGAGGHSEAILKSNPRSKIFTVDRDPVAYELAKKLSSKYP
jgi:16S rRNA C1402 N4-methylase RsmH